MNKWKQEDIEFLIDNYPNHGKVWCMDKLNKTEGQIRAMAAKFKLKLNTKSEFFIEFQNRAAKSKVGNKRPYHSKLMKKYAKEGKFPILTDERTKEQRLSYSDRLKKTIKDNGHPKGMLGKKHNESVKEIVSIHSKKMWADKKHIVNSKEFRNNRALSQSKRMVENLKNNTSNQYSRVKKGRILIEDKVFFARSSWEANIGAYLQYLKEEKIIKDWFHEAEEYRFHEIKRGCLSYLPDFKVINNDDSFYLIEVKGYMDSKSKTKLRRMKKYYPEVKIELIESKRYNKIKSTSYLFKHWGLLD